MLGPTPMVTNGLAGALGSAASLERLRALGLAAVFLAGAALGAGAGSVFLATLFGAAFGAALAAVVFTATFPAFAGPFGLGASFLVGLATAFFTALAGALAAGLFAATFLVAAGLPAEAGFTVVFFTVFGAFLAALAAGLALVTLAGATFLTAVFLAGAGFFTAAFLATVFFTGAFATAFFTAVFFTGFLAAAFAAGLETGFFFAIAGPLLNLVREDRQFKVSMDGLCQSQKALSSTLQFHLKGIPEGWI